MSQRRQAVLTTGVDVWGYFAAHLYSYPLTCIVARELYQNARDACRRTGRTPRITLTVVADDQLRYGRVSCRDNGCGMDEETILDRFLCLGGTDKVDGDTGGFGIAKAVILGGCTWWEVRTQELYVSTDHVRQGLPLDSGRRWLAGTRVTLRYDPLPEHDPRYRRLRLSPWALARALSWLAHNDSPCTVVTRAGGQKAQAWQLEGVSTPPDRLVLRGAEGRTTWKLYQVPAQSLRPLSVGGSTYTVESAGQVFVRLHGLTQFTVDMGEHPDCWLLDVETEALPRDADYPFNLSREEFSKSIRNELEDVLEAHRMNPVSSHRRQFRHDDCPDTLYFPGSWLEAEAVPVAPPGAASPAIPLDGDVPLPDREGGRRLSVFSQSMNPIRSRQASPLGYAVMIKGIDKTGRDVLAPHNLRLLAAWAQIVQLVMRAGRIRERFGVGFVFDAHDLAERVVDSQGVYYLINPTLCRLAVSRARATLVKMFVLAGHEVAHQRAGNHNEYHSSWMGSLLEQGAVPFAAHLNRLTRELEGKSASPLIQELQLSFEELLEE
jgi:hypothetical protein